MSRGVELVIVLVAFWGVSTAVQGLFPKNRTLVYNYNAHITASFDRELHEPLLGISGQLHIKHDTSDAKQSNAFMVALKNVTRNVHIGKLTSFIPIEAYTPIPEATRVLENPFLIVYNKSGYLLGVKFPENEPNWSRNMKQALALMFQLDQRLMLAHSDTPREFVSQEKTIFGDCLVKYKIHDFCCSSGVSLSKEIKSSNQCSNFKSSMFDFAGHDTCDDPTKTHLIAKSLDTFIIEKNENSTVIRSVVLYGSLTGSQVAENPDDYAIGDAVHCYLQDNVVGDFTSDINWSELPLITDMTYQKPTATHARGAAVDVTGGRYSMNRSDIIASAKVHLNEAIVHLNANYTETNIPNLEESNFINKLRQTLSLMDVEAFNETYSELNESLGWSDNQIQRDIFLKVLPYVGTHASAIFLKNLVDINLRKTASILPQTIVNMLIALPMNVRNPTEELLRQIEQLIFVNIPEVLSPDILSEYNFLTVYESEKLYSASMLNFATLVFRTFENTQDPEENELLNKYINIFENQLVTSNYCQRKMIAVQALGNVQLGRSRDILAAVIGDVLNVGRLVGCHPADLRINAIWAVERSLPDYSVAHKLLWPIVVNETLVIKLRLAAYDVLIRKSKNLPEILSIHSFMLNHTSPHLQHYHYTTIKNMAKDEDSCNVVLKQLAETLLTNHTEAHPKICVSLSQSHVVSSTNYGHKDTFALSYTLNPTSGDLEVVTMEYSTVDGSRRKVPLKFQLILSGIPLPIISKFILNLSAGPISMEFVKDTFSTSFSQLETKDLIVNLVVWSKGRVVYARYLPDLDFLSFIVDLAIISANGQVLLSYDDFYEEQIVSQAGLPVVKRLQTPELTLLRLDIGSPPPPDEPYVFSLSLKTLRHSEHTLAFYNPFDNVWHSVGRSTSTRSQFYPIVLLKKAQGEQPMEISIPVSRYPLENQPVYDLMRYSHDYLGLEIDHNDTLYSHCPTCKSREVLSARGRGKKNIVELYESKSTGFQVKEAIFDCDDNIVIMPWKRDLRQDISTNPPKSWSQLMSSTFFAYRQLTNPTLSTMAEGSCGVRYEISPSSVHPTALFKATLRAVGGFQESADPAEPSDLRDWTMRINGSCQAIPIGTTPANPGWLLNGTITLEPRHKHNFAFFNLTRVEADGNKLRVCLKYDETYSSEANNVDPGENCMNYLESPLIKKITWNMADVNDDQCPSGVGNGIQI